MVKIEHREELAVVVLDDGKVNALSLELLTELESCLEKLMESDVRALVLTGGGRCFSAGVDLFRVVSDGEAYLEKFLAVLDSALGALFAFPKPVVAAVNGHAIAGGCILAWACDARLMAVDCGRIGVTELAVGVPFPALPLEIVRFAVPVRCFQEVVYGAETYLPETALAMGLLDRIVPPENLLDDALAVAEKYAAIPARAFALSKTLMRRPALRRAEQNQQEFGKAIAGFWRSPQAVSSIRAFLDNTVSK